jgi:hypothetical protein
MAGGLMQLSAYGTENQYLNGNPQITYFKVVYKRYTNFAIETINIQLNGQQNAATQLSWSEDTVLKTKIPRNADLLGSLYITFDLPDIFSSQPQGFQWIKDIGITMINYVRIYIGGYKIEELTGEEIYLWSRLSLSDEKLKSFNEMVGNLPQLYDPTLPKVDSVGEYPGYDPQPSTGFFPTLITSKYYDSAPSISGRTLYVPLPCWFSKYHGCALPLIALQYHDVDFEISLRPVRELYTVQNQEIINSDFVPFKYLSEYPSDDLTSTTPVDMNIIDTFGDNQVIIPIPSYLRAAPNDTPEQYITNFTPQVTGNRIWNLNPQLFGNYIFLDDSERKVFAEIAHQYLFDQHYQVQSQQFYGDFKQQFEVFHPGKEIYFPLQRSDVNLRNEWTNYTLFDYEGQDVKSYNNYWWQLCNIINQGYNGYIILNNSKSLLAHFTGIVDLSLLNNIPINYFSILFGPNGLSQLGNPSFTPPNPPIPVFGIRFTNGGSPLLGTVYDIQVPYLLLYTANQIFEFRNNWKYRSINIGNIPVITTLNSPFWTENIIEEAFLEFDGNIREDRKDFKYWSQLQPYLYHTNSGISGLNIYSFSLNPDEYQPKGACNFSQLRNIFIHVKTKQPEIINGSLAYQFEMHGYLNYYNVLQIQAGMGGIMFAN